MNIAIILIIIVVALFTLAYFTRRRFGVLGLALCAGYLLSIMWADNATTFVRDLIGIDTPMPILANAVTALLVVAPTALVLFRSPTYHKKRQRLIGATVFALLTVAFILTPLSNSVNFDDASKKVYTILNDNRNMIITAGIAYALYDLMTFRTPKKEK
jgi:hypothetical protein